MNGYAFPAWRRVAFVAVLIVILVVSFAPSITQGTVNVRVYGFVQPGPITHLYVRFSEVQLHTAGYPSDSGWITLTNLLPSIDLIPQTGQAIPESIISTQIQSGRYDAMKLKASNSTVIIANVQRTAISAGSTISGNLTLPIPPSGVGEVLVVISFDYAKLLSSQPTLSLSPVLVAPI